MLKLIIFLLIFFNYCFSVNYLIDDISNLKRLSKLNDQEAIFKLGTIYYKGELTKQNLDLSLYYFKKIKKDNIKAQYNIASIFANKKYKGFNRQKAFKIYLKLAQEDYPPAQNMVGLYFLYGVGVQKDYTKAKKWFEYAFFEHNYIKAGCNLAYIYTYGKGVIVNLGRARKLVKKGYTKHISRCIKIYNDFNLYKYKEDKGFKFGYYKNF